MQTVHKNTRLHRLLQAYEITIAHSAHVHIPCHFTILIRDDVDGCTVFVLFVVWLEYENLCDERRERLNDVCDELGEC
jgi:hypothetical protein